MNTSPFINTRVFVIGDVMLDEYHYGESTRMSPEAPVPIINLSNGSAIHAIGGAGNVAINCCSLGAIVTLLGLIGADTQGQRIRQLCEEAEIDSVLYPYTDRTTHKTRFYANNKCVVRVDYDSEYTYDKFILERVKKEMEAQIAESHVVIASDYCKGVFVRGLKYWLVDTCSKHGKPLIVDTKSKDFVPFTGCTCICPNLEEAQRYILHNGNSFIPPEVICCDLTGIAKHPIITMGADGIVYIARDGGIAWSKAVKAQIFDVTGAGDTVTAAVALGFTAGWDMKEICDFANKCAGVVVRKRGTAHARWEETI